MENMVVVRKAELKDIPQIQKVSKEAFKIYTDAAGITNILGELNETKESIKKEIESKEVFVAEAEGNIVGCVRVEIKSDGSAYLSRFGVSADYQKGGIGKALIEAVDLTAKKFGVSNLYLHTASTMLSLVRFYYGKGFYIVSTAKDKGYIRALLCKEYKVEANVDTLDNSVVV